MKIKDGMKEYGCKDHGIDYRICCEECNEKWTKFKKIADAIVEDNNQDEVAYD